MNKEKISYIYKINDIHSIHKIVHIINKFTLVHINKAFKIWKIIYKSLVTRKNSYHNQLTLKMILAKLVNVTVINQNKEEMKNKRNKMKEKRGVKNKN